MNLVWVAINSGMSSDKFGMSSDKFGMSSDKFGMSSEQDARTTKKMPLFY